MAASDSVTIQNLTGDFIMDKKLSDNPEPMLAFIDMSKQGIGWMTRKAIGLATITLHIKQFTNEAGVVQIDIEQTATGGVKGTTEIRHLDWKESDHDDHVFGKVRGKSRFIKVADVDDPFLKSNWREETDKGDAIESYVVSVDNGWIARQIWGFQDKDGKRMYARNIVVTKGSDRKEIRLYYDYVSA
ncbi:MAG: hypothetical protein Q9162_005849 [Coniocarpon cinnabarinum]